jgi:DNA repair exonuclease SbcCD ATPase subunit
MQQLASTTAILNTYDGWAAQRTTRVTSELEFEGQSYRDSRLANDTAYGRAEVATMLSEQLRAVIGVAVKEQEALAASSRALVKTILAENDRQRVPVEIDATAALNQGTHISAIEAAEQRVAAKGPARLGALPSLNSGDAQAKQLSEAHEEIRRLNERMRAMQQRFEEAMNDRSKLNQDVLSMQDTIGSISKEKEQLTVAQQQQLQQQHAQMQQQNAMYRGEVQSMRQQLVDAQKELTGKLSQSTQFLTLKRMLNEKNDLAKQLRASLMRYDPAAAAIGGSDDIEAEDDD